MALTSVIYLIFLAGVLLIYYILPRRMQWFVLMLASIGFIAYGIQNPLVYVVIAYGILVTFIGAIAIENTLDERKRKRRKIITIVLILLELIAFKYLDFLELTVNILRGTDNHSNLIKSIAMLAPLGISFYTLISIGYVLDVSRKTVRAQRHLLRYILFVLYFPQITSGPITRYYDMDEQLYEKHNFDIKNVAFGFQRIIWGMFKKLVISERTAVLVNTVFDNYGNYSGLYVVIGALAFAIQLYTDFSGCMDIVIGTSETFGITLPENFNTPFFSKSISEYWRRWHITLGTWFKDYFFYPILKSDCMQNLQQKLKPKVGKKWSKKIPTYLGMLALWITIGLWHGGNYTYVIGSGILHWFYIVAGEICSPVFKKIAGFCRLKETSPVLKVIQMVRTSLLVCIGFVFFRSDSVGQAVHMLTSIFRIDKNIDIYSLGLSQQELIVMGISVLVVFAVSIIKTKTDVREFISKRNILIRYAVWISLISVILVLGYYGIGYDSQAFIYQKF